MAEDQIETTLSSLSISSPVDLDSVYTISLGALPETFELTETTNGY
jgi:hypothetical protein